MTEKLIRSLPAGYKIKSIKKTLNFSFLAAFVFSSFSYVNSFLSALNALYYYDTKGERVLNIYESMPKYQTLRENCFASFKILIICMLAFAVINFIYHFIGSKSIYTMLRLKNRGELMKRCIAVPAAVIVISIFTVLILNLVFYGIYVLAVPPECLYPDWREMWRF